METPASKNDKPALNERLLAGWNRFWFTPADPTVLGLVRLGAGLITLYTVLAYSLNLQDFFGRHAWWDLASAQRNLHERPYQVTPLRGYDPLSPAENPFQEKYAQQYLALYGSYPPAPFPKDQAEALLSFEFQNKYGFDFRQYHMPFPTTAEQETFLREFCEEYKIAPAPPYPKDEEEAQKIRDYVERWKIHPYVPMYARGSPVWSVWFHVTDPAAMALVHAGIVLAVFLFTIGFCTRITSVLTWMGSLSYIHRANVVLFGVDTMMTILLLYLMIGPSGAALSVDRRIARWWSKARPRIIGRWRAFWRLPAVNIAAGPAPSSRPVPSVGANLAIRLLQVHLCIVYLAAGLSKLLGQSWWDGTAVWSTIANFEFAPMQYEIYNWFLRTLGKNQLVFMVFLTSASYFTLFFEIGYAFLIWRQGTRWLMLGMAITLHGFIGLFMGLKSFSLMMLVMNAVFLRPDEAKWLLDRFFRKGKPAPPVPKSGDRSEAIRPAAEALAVRPAGKGQAPGT